MSENFISKLPVHFRRNVTDSCGVLGKRWLSDLPKIISELETNWAVRAKKHFPNLSYNYVAPCVLSDGGEAVLKLGLPEKNPIIFSEAAFLRTTNGSGTVKLLRFDADYRALLLERLIPGDNLKRLCEKDDEKATRIAAGVLNRIRRELPENGEFPTLENWISSFQSAESNDYAADIMKKMKKAQGYFAELMNSTAKRLLLHGDFHHQNILSARREQFLAIDPKGIVGDIGFEIAVFLNNPRGWLLSRPDRQRLSDRRVGIFAEAFAIEPGNLRKWAFAEAVLSAWWTIEDGGSGAEKWLACAEIWET